MMLPYLAENVLGSAVINLNTIGKQNIFTVPSGKSCIITRLIFRSSSATITGTASFGWDASATDVRAAAAGLSAITSATYSHNAILITNGSKIGTTGGVFGAAKGTSQVATFTVDAIGYFY